MVEDLHSSLCVFACVKSAKMLKFFKGRLGMLKRFWYIFKRDSSQSISFIPVRSFSSFSHVFDYRVFSKLET